MIVSRYLLQCLFVLATYLVGNPAFADCNSPVGVAGESRWDTTALDLLFCDGTVWKSLRYGGVKLISNTTAPTLNNIDSVEDVHISGNYAFVHSRTPAALYVIDIADINNPVIAGSVLDAKFNHADSDLVVSGSYLFGVFGSYLLIFDISDPTNPMITSTLSDVNINSSKRLVVVGNYVYIATTNKLTVVDVTSKTLPAVVGSVALSNTSEVAVSGNYAYVGRNGSMSIVDISNPASPSIVSTLTNAKFNNQRGIQVSGNFVYFVANTSPNAQLSVIDVTNKNSPNLVNSVISTGADHLERLTDIELHGGFITVTQANGRNAYNYLTIYDINSPLNLKKIAITRIPNFGTCTRISIVGFKGACLAEGTKNIYFFDTAPKPVLPFTPEGTLFSPDSSFLYSVDVSGGLAVSIDSSLNLWVFDVTNPSTPVSRGAFAIPQTVNRYSTYASLAFDGTYAYVTSTNASTLYVLDVGTNPSKPVLVSSIQHTSLGQADGIRVVGGYAYIAASSGLTILDISSPSAPAFVSHLNFPGASAKGVFVAGNYAYITGSQTFSIFDVTNKSSPILVGSLTDATNLNGVYDLEVDNNYAYLQTSGRLTILDISAPSTPVVATSLVSATYGSSTVIEKIGNYVVSTSPASKGVVTDVSVPTAPSIVNSTTIGSCCTWMKISGGLLYGVSSANLGIHDLSTPATPALIVNTTYQGLLSGASGLDVSGTMAYVTASTRHQFHVIDFSNPSDPTIVKTITDSVKIASPKNVKVAGSYAYVVGSNYLTIVDITIPVAADIVGRISDSTHLNGARAVEVAGNYVFVVTSNGVSVFDVTNKTIPTFVTSVSDPQMTDCRDITLSGTNAYIPCFTSNSIGIISISNPGSPVILSVLQNATKLTNAGTVEVAGSYAYVGMSNGVAVVDISSPSNPTLISNTSTTSIKTIRVKGDYLFASTSSSMYVYSLKSKTNLNMVLYDYIPVYALGSLNKMSISGNKLVTIGSNKAGIQIWDISDRGVAVEGNSTLNSSNHLGGPTDVKVVGNYAYVLSTTSQRLTVLDISNPLAPVILGSLYDYRFEQAKNLDVDGSYAYLSGYNYLYTMPIVDISNPAAMSVVGSYNSFFNVDASDDLKKVGDYVYLTSSSRFSAINVSNPAAPTLGSYVTVTVANGFAIRGNYAYVCSSSATALTFSIVDISNPSAITIDSTFSDSTLSYCSNMTVSGNYLYVHSGTNKSLTIFDLSSPTAPVKVSSLSDPSLTGSGGKIVINGDTLYIPSTYVIMIDVTNKSDPKILTSFSSSTVTHNLRNVFLDGIYTYGVHPYSHSLTIYESKAYIKLGSCTVSGEFNFNTSQNVASICDGTSSYSMSVTPGVGGAGCSSPSGPKGDLRYFPAELNYKFCDGTNWVKAGL